jgi:hypothetical protein
VCKGIAAGPVRDFVRPQYGGNVNEAEWLACEEPRAMLEFARHKVSRRKYRLFACVCCRRAPDADPRDERGEAALALAERLADGLETNAARAQALEEVWTASLPPGVSFEELLAQPFEPWVRLPTYRCALESNPVTAAQEAARFVSGCSGEERAILCSLIRDIFGNPFRAVDFSPEWSNSTVVTLARQMYDSREFSAMPILADALQDAGCDDEDVLNHCRDPGLFSGEPFCPAGGNPLRWGSFPQAGPLPPFCHVRGCWVVDVVLGNE